MNGKQLFNLFFVFFFVGGLAFFFVNDRSTESSLFGQAYSTLLGEVGQAVSQASKFPKSDYKAVYNCNDRQYGTYVVAGKRMGYGFGLKADSLASRKVNGFGYGYCMNFQSSTYVDQRCLMPDYKKVYECTGDWDVFYGCSYQMGYGFSRGALISSQLKGLSGLGYGYGFSRDAFVAGRRNGWGIGTCLSYKPSPFSYYNQASYYFDKAVKCQAGIK